MVALLVGVGASTAAFLLPSLYHRPNPTEYTFEVSVWLKPDISAADRDAVRSGLAGIDTIAGVKYESREQAYENFKNLYKDSPDLVESVKADSLPESFYFETKRAEFDCGMLEPVTDLPAVDNVTVMKVSMETSPPRTPVDCG
jgi:cell division transport system permease protein